MATSAVSKHWIKGQHESDLYAYDRTAPGVQGFEGVDDAAVTQFVEEGYCVIHEAFSVDEIVACQDGINDLIDGKNPAFNALQFERDVPDNAWELPLEQRQLLVRKLMNFIHNDARLVAMSRHPKLLGLVERLLGEAPTLFQDMALLKPPGIGSEKPWHQDNAYFNIPPATLVVGAWIALDPATAENGCMHIIPGSHLAGPHVHFNRRDWQLCDSAIPAHQDVMVPLAPGGMLIFQGLMWHGTPHNHSPLRRRALQFHYHGASVHAIAQEERMACFGHEGKDVEC